MFNTLNLLIYLNKILVHSVARGFKECFLNKIKKIFAIYESL